MQSLASKANAILQPQLNVRLVLARDGVLIQGKIGRRLGVSVGPLELDAIGVRCRRLNHAQPDGAASVGTVNVFVVRQSRAN